MRSRLCWSTLGVLFTILQREQSAAGLSLLKDILNALTTEATGLSGLVQVPRVSPLLIERLGS